MKKTISDLLEVMAQLRDPDSGCVWDKEQTYKTIVPHTIEEAYEVAEVIETENLDELCSELGDLLFQIVFYAQIAKEEGRFDFSDVVDGITQKMIRRHPHVFSNENVGSVVEQKQRWEEIKRQENVDKKQSSDESVLSGVNWHMPSQSVARKLQNKAASVGFDWPDWKGPFEKIHEEMDELTEAIENKHAMEAIQGEMGDVLFAAVNLARALKIEPEAALRQTNRKFDQRFRCMEDLAKSNNKEFKALSLVEQEAYWQQVKRERQD